MIKKNKAKILKDFKIFIMKFLTEHNEHIILENNKLLDVQYTLPIAPTGMQTVDFVFCTLAIFAGRNLG